MAFPNVVVEAGFTNSATSTALLLNDAVKGKLDTGTLAGEIWTDITTYVRKVTVRRGATRAEGPVLRFEAGTCTITLDNSDRRFDPTNTTGPYAGGGATQVTPMRPVRVTASYAGINYEMFRGYADSWDIDWIGSGDSMCTLSATDATKVLSNYDRVALVTPVGASEDSGARVSRVLDSIAWPTYDRVIDTGDSTMQATTLDRSAWEELVKVQDSEIGSVYVDAGGRVVFKARSASLKGRSAVSQATFGDGVGEWPFKDTTISYDDTTLANLVRISNVGGTQQTASDATSQDSYLTHTFDRTDLILETDSAAASYAGFILYQSKDPELRFTSLSVNPHDDPNVLFPAALGLAFGDRITVKRRPPGGGTISRDVFIRGVAHDIEAPMTWTTTWALQSATRWSFMTLDNPVLGVLDANAISF